MNPRLRIASVCEHLYFGGDASRLLAFGRALDPARADHVVVELAPEDEEAEMAQKGAIRAWYASRGVEVVGLSPGPSGEPPARKALRILDELVALLREREINVVDGRMGHAIIFGAAAGRTLGIPAVSATEYNTETFWDRRPLKGIAGRVAFHLSHALICDSHAQLAKLQRWLGAPHRRPLVIPNGIFPPGSPRDPAEMRRRFGLPTDPRVRVVGTLCRLVPYKGHRTLIEAMARVLREAPDVALLCCGYQSPLPEDRAFLRGLVELSRELGIEERVRFVSYPGEADDVWQAVDIHAHPSELDSSPIAIHESMALGLPAVVTSVGGIPELVADGETGLIVPPADAGALAEALLRLLRDPALAARLGAAARRRFEARHHARAMTGALQELYGRLVATGGRG